jgi:hypothetical protein
MMVMLGQGNPEAAWSHDLYNEEEEGRRATGGKDLGNTGFLKRSLSGGGGSDKTTVEITNLSYDVADSELNVPLPLSLSLCVRACVRGVCCVLLWADVHLSQC